MHTKHIDNIFMTDGQYIYCQGIKEVFDTEKNQYVVKKGHTLYSISKKYKVSIDQLIKKNNLKSNNISIGQKLKI